MFYGIKVTALYKNLNLVTESGTNLHVHLIFELQDLLLVLLQLRGGQGDHLLQLLLQHRLAVGHNLQLSLKGLYLLLGDK